MLNGYALSPARYSEDGKLIPIACIGGIVILFGLFKYNITLSYSLCRFCPTVIYLFPKSELDKADIIAGSLRVTAMINHCGVSFAGCNIKLTYNVAFVWLGDHCFENKLRKLVDGLHGREHCFAGISREGKLALLIHMDKMIHNRAL